MIEATFVHAHIKFNIQFKYHIYNNLSNLFKIITSNLLWVKYTFWCYIISSNNRSNSNSSISVNSSSSNSSSFSTTCFSKQQYIYEIIMIWVNMSIPSTFLTPCQFWQNLAGHCRFTNSIIFSFLRLILPELRTQ
jgi:hypothetical protein